MAQEAAPYTTAAMFGEVLKLCRKAAGMTQAALAREIPCDRSHVARVEAGKQVPQDTFAIKCDEVLKTGGVLQEMRGKIDWYPNVEHPDWFERRVEMEAMAVALRSYQTSVVPGLLQTEGYMRALFSLHITDTKWVEERVKARLSRQPRFFAPDGPQLIIMMDESCLRSVVGGPAVMHAQCAHLLHAAERPNIRIQVAPFADPRIDRPNTSMCLLRLPDGEEWLYSESLLQGYFSNDPVHLARYNRTYDALRADALSARESVALISDVMEGYGRHALDQEQLQRDERRRLRGNRVRYPRRRPRP